MENNNLRLQSFARRGQPISIEVDGEPIQAFEGETIATALLAAGRRVLRHTQEGTPRGVFCGMGVCFDCVVAVNKNIHIIPGIEFSSYLSPSEVHILGYFIDVNNIFLQKMIQQSRDDRVNRIRDMVDKLHSLHVDIDAQEIFVLAGPGSPGRMHVAETLWKRGYCDTILESFQNT